MTDIQTKTLAGAFLRYGDEALLMKRGLHKKIAPGMWASVGGHMEESDAGSPLATCLREIEEETGILPEQIESLTPRYVTLIKTEDSLDSIYYFTGVLKSKPERLLDTPEGTLHWITLADGLSLEMTAHVKALYAHWVSDLDGDSLHCLVEGEIGLLTVQPQKEGSIS